MPFNASFSLTGGGSSSVFTVEELFRQLSYGELSNLAVAVEASGTIKKERQNQIIHFTNEALKKLHNRLPLIRTSEDIVIADGDSDITLDDDVLMVESIISSTGQSFPFINIPSPTTKEIRVYGGVLHIPDGLLEIGTELKITYRKRHAVLDLITTPADLTQEITLLTELESALRSYIAFKVFSAMGTQDSVVIASNYQAMYEQAITEVLNSGLLSGELMPMSKLEMRGFV